MGYISDKHVVRELLMYCHNTEPICRQLEWYAQCIAIKVAKGNYNHELALKGMIPIVFNAIKAMGKDWGFNGLSEFTKDMRRQAEADLLEHFKVEIDLGNFNQRLPKKYQSKGGKK
jgi:hypothetical protein